MTQIELFQGRLLQLRKDIKEALLALIKENNITSVNLGAYTRETSVQGYTFFSVDKNGNGEALEADVLTVNGDKVTIDMTTNEEGYFGQYDLEDFLPHEMLYLLTMLTEVIAYAKENNQPILKELQSFEDMEN